MWIMTSVILLFLQVKHMGQVKYDTFKGSFLSCNDVRAFRGAESSAQDCTGTSAEVSKGPGWD